MLNSIKQFFENNIRSESVTSKEADERSLRLATAALYIEMMRADAEVTNEERKKVAELIRSKFYLSKQETEDLLRLANNEAKRSLSYHEFTTLINKGFSIDEKIRIVEHLWEIAFVDGNVDKYEEHMVRKIAGLIFVEHKDFIDAKLRVKEKLLQKPSDKL